MKLLIRPVMAAAKNSDSRCYDYDYYLRIGGISEKDTMERLEGDMNNVLEGDLTVTEDEIKAHHVQHSGKQWVE